MPISQARRSAGRGFSAGHFKAYQEFSERVRELLLRFTPLSRRLAR